MQYNLFNNDYCGKIHLSQYIKLGYKARTLKQERNPFHHLQTRITITFDLKMAHEG